MRFVAQMPKAVRDELLRDLTEVLESMGLEKKTIAEAIENAKDSKVRDVIGNAEDGLAEFEKYKEWM